MDVVKRLAAVGGFEALWRVPVKDSVGVSFRSPCGCCARRFSARHLAAKHAC